MGFVSGLLGTAGGAGGTGFSGPKSANVLKPTTVNQANTAYQGVQSGLNQQQQFLEALQAQQGLQNQSNVYNQLANVAAGQGPNPAQAMLSNATGANVANQAALMASQRGSNANAGLMARQAAQQGAGIQQQAAGQGAALQAQQSLNALSGMGAMANQQAQQQQAATAGMTEAQLASQQNLLNSIAQQNNAAVGMQSNINNANANLAGGVMGQQGNILGGLMTGAGIGMMMAQGGQVDPTIGQGLLEVQPLKPIGSEQASKGAEKLGKATGSYIKDYFSSPGVSGSPMSGGGPGMMRPVAGFASGGQVPALLSPGEKYLPPQAVKQVANGANPMQVGKTIPGKPKVGGAKDSYANDTVKATLQEGGIVLPRSVTKSSKPDRNAEAFVKAILAKKGQLPKKG